MYSAPGIVRFKGLLILTKDVVDAMNLFDKAYGYIQQVTELWRQVFRRYGRCEPSGASEGFKWGVFAVALPCGIGYIWRIWACGRCGCRLWQHSGLSVRRAGDTGYTGYTETGDRL